MTEGGKQLRLDTAREHLAGMDVLYRRICQESARHLLPRTSTVPPTFTNPPSRA